VTKLELENLMRTWFPMRASNELASLEFVEITEREQRGDFGVVVRLVIWDSSDGNLTIRDIKEQDVFLDMPIECTLDRLGTYLAALEVVLVEVLASKNADYLMPHDLLDLSALELVRAQTTDDFAKALRVKSRLGKYL
jgi:hypothetical protein